MPLSCLNHPFLIHITVSTWFMSFYSFMDVRWLRLIWGNSIYPAFYISIHTEMNFYTHESSCFERKNRGTERNECTSYFKYSRGCWLMGLIWHMCVSGNIFLQVQLQCPRQRFIKWNRNIIQRLKIVSNN